MLKRSRAHSTPASPEAIPVSGTSQMLSVFFAGWAERIGVRAEFAGEANEKAEQSNSPTTHIPIRPDRMRSLVGLFMFSLALIGKTSNANGLD
jgi:hypothetical protein